MTFEQRMLCAATAALLRAEGVLAVPALGAAAAALVLLLGWPAPPAGIWLLLAWAVLGLVLPERWLALRVRLDAALFARLAESEEGGDDPLAHLDAALHALRLRAPPDTPRPLADRVDGARRLAVAHAAIAGLQCLLLLPLLAALA